MDGNGAEDLPSARADRTFVCDCPSCQGAEVPRHWYTIHQHLLTLHTAQESTLSPTTSAPGDEDIPMDSAPENATVGGAPIDAAAELRALRNEIQRAMSSVPNAPNLVFSHSIGDRERGVPDISSCSPLDLELDEHAPDNKHFLFMQKLVDTLQQQLTELLYSPADAANYTAAQADLDAVRAALLNVLVTQYYNQRKAVLNILSTLPSTRIVNSDKYFRQSVLAGQIIPLAICLTILVGTFIFHLSGRQTTWLLGAAQALAKLVAERVAIHAGHPPHEFQLLTGNIPTSLGSILRLMDSAVDLRHKVLCPTCWHLSDRVLPGQNIRCEHVVLGEVCGAALYRKTRSKGRDSWVPINELQYQSLIDWLAHLMSRPGVEEHMDACVPTPSSGTKITDIWGAKWVHSLIHENKNFFLGADAAKNEGRYAFSMAVDWFIPKKGKKAWTVGAVVITCLNLPKHLRFLPEYVCVLAIIPGPVKPTSTQLHHILNLAVQDFHQLWEGGIWLTRTFRYPMGRLVRGALGPVVCDLDAVRAVSGFTPHTHTLFCSYCLLTRWSMRNFDPQTWPQRDPTKHREHAARWLLASTDAERKSLASVTGITWSPLLKLLYWDPLVCTVIDVMHNLLLGLLHHHCRNIWGISVKASFTDNPQQVLLQSPPTAEEMARGRHALRVGRPAALRRLHLPTLRGLCYELRLFEEVNSTREQMVETLLHYRLHVLNISIDDVANDVVDYDEADIALLLATPVSQWQRLIDKKVLWRVFNRRQPIANQVALNNIRKDRLVTEVQILIQPAPVTNPDELMAEVLKKPRKDTSSGGKVLGRDILTHYRWDRSRTWLPSWMKAAPKQVGTKAHGTLTADQWRVFATVHLIFTLVRLWGPNQQSSSSRRLAMLDNFISLVLATRYATNRSILEWKIQAFTFHITTYLQGMLVLYPGAKVVPNHHLALHIPTSLTWFGPAHAWWTFPFERLYGWLQKIHTNDRFGQLEKTILTRFYQAQVIYTWIYRLEVPAPLKNLMNSVRALWSRSRRQETSGWEWECHPLSRRQRRMAKHQVTAEETRLLATTFPLYALGRSLHLCASFTRQSSRFDSLHPDKLRTWETGRNTTVMFYDNVNKQRRMGRIIRIFYLGDDASENSTFAIVVPYLRLPAELEVHDPFRRYPELGAALLYDQYEAPQVVCSNDILTHAARCKWTCKASEQLKVESLVAVMPLDRV